MSRTLKQFLYGGIFLLILFGLAYVVYLAFLKPAPSCFDTKQNQGEAGVDCGGPCTRGCIPTDLSPVTVVGRPTFYAPTANAATLLARVQNANGEFAGRRVSYRFTVRTDAGESTVRGETFLYTSEVKYVVGTFRGDTQSVRSVDLAVDDVAWVPRAQFAKPAISVQDLATVATSTGLTVSGRIVNDSAFSLPRVSVVVLFSGGSGFLAGATATELENVAANSTRNFTVLHPVVPSVNPGATQAFVYAAQP